MERLSYSQLNLLVNDPFSENSPLIVKDLNKSDLLKVPILQEILTLCEIVEREEEIKLTQNGNLPVKIVRQLYEDGPLKNYFVENNIDKLYKEENCEEIHFTHLICKLIKIFTKSKGKIRLSKKSNTLRNNQNDLLKLIIKALTLKLNTAYFDGFQNESIGQIGIFYTIFLLNIHGSKTMPVKFYSNKYLEIFPEFIKQIEESEFSTKLDMFEHCYSIRSFHRCLNYLGILKINKHSIFRINSVMPNNLFFKLFEFKTNEKYSLN